MSFWETILSLDKNPKMSDLSFSYSTVARDLKRRNVFEDIVQIEPCVFAVANQRQSIREKRNEYITNFFWADRADAILRAVYGDVTRSAGAYGMPPPELLIVPGRQTYREIVADSEERKMRHSHGLVWSQSSPNRAPVGLCLSTNRIDYYFVCLPEESAEFKDWNVCRPVVIGFRTHLGRPIE